MYLNGLIKSSDFNIFRETIFCDFNKVHGSHLFIIKTFFLNCNIFTFSVDIFK